MTRRSDDVASAQTDIVRAGVFIGVDKAGTLEELQAAASGAREMYEWALSQGMSPKNVRLVTDEDGAIVDPARIVAAIDSIVSGSGVDQLIVYFAGHGVFANTAELWLLSDATRDTAAVINTYVASELARYCGAGHVVIISDACRGIADASDFAWMLGSGAFPNHGTTGPTNPVDQLAACARGQLASEVQDSNATAYSALYTSVLLEALNGARHEILEPSSSPNDQHLYLRLDRLAGHLAAEVPKRIVERGLLGRVNQDPEWREGSPSSWLARHKAPPFSDRHRGGPDPSPPADPDVALPETPQALALSLVQAAIVAPWDSEGPTDIARSSQTLGAQNLAATMEGASTTAMFDPLGTRMRVPVGGPDEFAVNVLHPDYVHEPNLATSRAAASASFVTFDEGTSAIVPVIPGYAATLTVSAGSVVDIRYATVGIGEEIDALSGLRAVAAATSRFDVFRLDGTNAKDVVDILERNGWVDPALAIYIAYALHDSGELQLLLRLADHLHASLGFRLYDLELLTGSTSLDDADERGVLPMAPMFSRGWALMLHRQPQRSGLIVSLARTLLPTPWSTFSAEGTAMLRDGLEE